MSQWLNEKIDAWPKQVRPFNIWLESTLDKKASKGYKAHVESLKRVCCYCGRGFDESYVDKTKDHVIPVSRGGLNTPQNKRPCCHDCNQWKKDLMPDEWLDRLIELVRSGKKIYEPHDKNTVGRMIGNLKRVINEIKQNKKKVSTYNF